MSSSSVNFLRYFALAVSAFGLIFLGWGGFALWEETASQNWPEVKGKVLQSEVKRWPKRKSEYDYRAEFSYEYKVDEIQYTGERIGTQRNRFKSQMEAKQALEGYPVGAPVSVHYNPNDPKRALLEPGLRSGTVFKTCLGLFLFIGGGVAALLSSKFQSKK